MPAVLGGQRAYIVGALVDPASGGFIAPAGRWSTAGAGPRFALFVHHTDGKREWAYDRDIPVGRLDRALDVAADKGWTVVDMARDWKVVYPAAK